MNTPRDLKKYLRISEILDALKQYGNMQLKDMSFDMMMVITARVSELTDELEELEADLSPEMRALVHYLREKREK